MFKQAESSIKETHEVKNIINQLGAITSEQQKEFAKLTGRFDGAFKIGKSESPIIGKSVN